MENITKQLTVGQLIEKLKKCPSNYLVWLDGITTLERAEDIEINDKKSKILITSIYPLSLHDNDNN